MSLHEQIEELSSREVQLTNELSKFRAQLRQLREALRASCDGGDYMGESQKRCLEAVCEVWQVAPGQLMGEHKYHYLIEPRHAYVCLMREEEDVPYTRIAHSINRHHTSARNSHKQARAWMKTDPAYRAKLTKCRELVRADKHLEA